MSAWLDRILQLKTLSTGGEDVELRFVHQFPAWAWVLALIAAVLLAGWSYWALLGNRAARTALASSRWLLLVLVAILIAGPQLVRQNMRLERDWVVLMADRSASMSVADAPGPAGARVSRDAQLRQALGRAWPALSKLSGDRNLLTLGFDAGVFDVPLAPEGPTLGDASGRRTAIGQSLEQALRRVSARPVAGVVLLSDGRSSDVPTRAVMRQLETRQIPVYVVPMGSASPLVDVAVGRIDAPSAAFVGDLVPVTAEIEQRGGEAGMTGKVQLIDDATGLPLDERALPRGPEPGRVTLVARPEKPGEARWTVRIVLDAPDLTAENNSMPVRLELADRPIRVVYFDGYPRWE